jgi:hypothetical protein
MSDPNDRHDDWKQRLECLRMASDFMQLSKQALDPDLKAHCLRMAKYWSDKADGLPGDETGVAKGLD